ncbi:MAG: outer membrane protein TolC [Planctomycetota bacterium]
MGSLRKSALAIGCLGSLVACQSTEAPPSRATLGEWVLERDELEFSKLDEKVDAEPIDLEAFKWEARTIDLTDVLTLVASQGLDIELARERYAEAQAEERIAEAAWWPSLSIGTSLSHNDGDLQRTDGVFLDVDTQNAWAGGGLRLDLDFGEAIYGTRAAHHRTQASHSIVDAESRNAVTIAALAFFDLVESHERLPITEDAQKQAGELVAFEEARLASGAGLEADLARAQAHQAAVQRVAIDAKVRALRASSVLIELLQLPAGINLAPISTAGSQALDLVEAAFLPVGGVQGGVVSDLIRTHPELVAAHSALAASEAEEDQAQHAWLLPSLVLGARVGALGYNYSDLNSQDIFTAALRWDIGAELFGNQDRMKSRRRQANIETRRTEARLQRELSIAAAELEGALLSVEASRLQAKAAASSEKLARDRHERGAALLIERLDAEVQSLRARFAETSARVNLNRAQFTYVRASGLNTVRPSALEMRTL